ncbi:hypothetical protein JKF63_04592 [Porcisia hertigi]|uniref:Histone RNA hairpin-binding protein RNA-binding domain-containing protein n=1 Tax=Porcisia hertigi TaxID=2761500 RepID=A0A836I4K8_9TRYP|nr:hypothetical protein JKF63_04592 [Porcisia hertigi]
MQQQEKQCFMTPPSAPQDSSNGSHTKALDRRASQSRGALLEGDRSQSPAPDVYGDAVSPPARQQPQEPQQRVDTTPSGRCPLSSQPRELFRAPQRHQQRQQQQQPGPTYGSRGRRGVGGSDRSIPNDWQLRIAPLNTGTSPRAGSSRPRTLSSCGNSPDEDRRRSQREKQIQYGYATDGFVNMKRLIAHDPLLKSGGLLPLSPPEIVKGSKRLWDIQLRKWRRALHMFDFVFINGEDDPATRETVLEEQRQQWVSEGFKKTPREMRLKIDLDTLHSVQNSSSVPSKIPVEDDLRCILRSEDCYESVRSVIPQSASSLTKGTDISPLEAGIKIHIAPSVGVLQRQQAQLEMQQRLSSLYQQQQQQQQQPVLAALAPQEGVELNVHLVEEVPSVPGATVGCAPAQRPIEPSPSPRRPPLPLQATQSPSRLPCHVQPQQACEATPHHQRCGNPRDKHSGVAFSCSPLPRTTAATASRAHSSAETAPGLSTHQPSVVSTLCSPAQVWGAPLGGPNVMSTAAALMPPPPLAAPLPFQVPNKWMPGVNVSSASAAAAAAAGPTTLPSMQPLSPWCGHCGHWINDPTSAITGVQYGGVCTGTASCCGGVSAPVQVPPSYVNTAALGRNSGVMTSLPAQLREAMPYTSHLSPATGDPATNFPLQWRKTAPPVVEPAGVSGPFATQRGSGHYEHPQSEARQDTIAAIPCVFTGDRSCPRDGRRRSSGAVAKGNGAITPQTVPRFVARLSTSPSEQRIGEWRPTVLLHSADVASGGVLTTAKPLDTDNRVVITAPTALRQDSHAFAAAASRPEKSQSLLTVTPDRALFGTDTIGEVTTEPRSVEVKALLAQEQQQHETKQDTPLGKPKAMPEVDDAPVIPLVFDGDE